MCTCDNFEPQLTDNTCKHCGYNEQEHYPNVAPVACLNCGDQLPLARLEFFPDTVYCVKCVDKCGPQKFFDPNVICAKASLSGQNGFSPRD